MSISATRRVSGSSNTSKVAGTNNAKYAAASEQFVEKIDTSNQVSVNADARNESSNKEKYTPQNKENREAKILSNQTYVAGAVEAISASGAYEEVDKREINRNRKISVYDTNQTIIRDEIEQEQEKYDNEHYIKHLYENNEPPEEVDELV